MKLKKQLKKVGFVLGSIVILFTLFWIGKLLNTDVAKIKKMLVQANENYEKINNEVKISSFSAQYLK